MTSTLSSHVPPLLLEVCRTIDAAGGRALVVGGWVRDRLLGRPESKDIDVEIFGLSREQVATALSKHGELLSFGQAFGVFQIRGIGADFTLPVSRRSADGAITHDPSLSFQEASRRRDLSINSMGWDPLSDELHDPHGGQRDLHARLLRATSKDHFGDDPLRALRVAQLGARLAFEIDDELATLCAAQDLSQVASERLYVEWHKLLLQSPAPSVGLEILRRCHLLKYFPPLDVLESVPQDPRWHPEGDVWVHTCMVVDQAAKLRQNTDDDLPLMFGALAHDFGKPSTTVTDSTGAIRSPGHDTAGIEPAQAFLEQMKAPPRLIKQVLALVEHHLAPALFVKQGASARAYRKLATKLAYAEVSIALLARTAKADHLGRTTPDALAGIFPAGEEFLQKAGGLSIVLRPEPDVVMGRHLIALGLKPGKEFGELLRKCRDVQDETGLTDADAILSQVLRKPATP